VKEHTRGNEILVIDSDAFAANQLEFNWGEVSVKEISQIELATKRKNTNVVGTKENEIKWHKLYGQHDFWSPKYYDLVIDTYASGPMSTVGKVLDKLGFKGTLNHKK